MNRRTTGKSFSTLRAGTTLFLAIIGGGFLGVIVGRAGLRRIVGEFGLGFRIRNLGIGHIEIPLIGCGHGSVGHAHVHGVQDIAGKPTGVAQIDNTDTAVRRHGLTDVGPFGGVYIAALVGTNRRLDDIGTGVVRVIDVQDGIKNLTERMDHALIAQGVDTIEIEFLGGIGDSHGEQDHVVDMLVDGVGDEIAQLLTLGEPNGIVEHAGPQDGLHHGQIDLVLSIIDAHGHVVRIIDLELEALGSGDEQRANGGPNGITLLCPCPIGRLGKGGIECVHGIHGVGLGSLEAFLSGGLAVIQLGVFNALGGRFIKKLFDGRSHNEFHPFIIANLEMKTTVPFGLVAMR